MAPRRVAFYLPQFHSIQENDLWWGKGFTEWTNVKRAALPHFPQQRLLKPHPDFGYYNLLDQQTRALQAQVAKTYGIDAFCYYHYWFNGKKLLEKPLELMLKDGEPNIKFMLCWANESWTRTWDGLPGMPLIEQIYGDKEDWENHFDYLMNFFEHENYIKLDGCPVFLIYRVGQIPKLKEMIDVFRILALKRGLKGLKILMALNYFSDSNSVVPYREFVDGVVQFEPNFQLGQRIESELEYFGSLRAYNIQKAWQLVERSNSTGPNHFFGTFPSWDNYPRRLDSALSFYGSTPHLFGDHFRKMMEKSIANKSDFLFINAWNEWGEGCTLEPSEAYGYEYLQQIQTIVSEYNERGNQQ